MADTIVRIKFRDADGTHVGTARIVNGTVDSTSDIANGDTIAEVEIIRSEEVSAVYDTTGNA